MLSGKTLNVDQMERSTISTQIDGIAQIGRISTQIDDIAQDGGATSYGWVEKLSTQPLFKRENHQQIEVVRAVTWIRVQFGATTEAKMEENSNLQRLER